MTERADGQAASSGVPQFVEVTIKRMETLADTALEGRLYEQECKQQMRIACTLLRDAYGPRSAGQSAVTVEQYEAEIARLHAENQRLQRMLDGDAVAWSQSPVGSAD